MSNIVAYSDIANNYSRSATRRISRQIVIDNQDSPKAVGVWGRLVSFLASLGKTPVHRKQIYQVAIENFRDALKEAYKDDALVAANQSLNGVTTANRSLRARDIYDAFRAADKVNAEKLKVQENDAAKRQNISEEMANFLGDELAKVCRKILGDLDNPIITDKGDLDPDENVALLLCTGRVSSEHTLKNINASLEYVDNNNNHDDLLIVRDNIDSALKKMEINNSYKTRDYFQIAQRISEASVLRKNDIFTHHGYTVKEVYEYNNCQKIQEDERNENNLIYHYKMHSHCMCHIKQEDESIKHFLMCKPNLKYRYYSTTNISDDRRAKYAHFTQV